LEMLLASRVRTQAYPIPAVPPVTTATLPLTSGTSERGNCWSLDARLWLYCLLVRLLRSQHRRKSIPCTTKVLCDGVLDCVYYCRHIEMSLLICTFGERWGLIDWELLPSYCRLGFGRYMNQEPAAGSWKHQVVMGEWRNSGDVRENYERGRSSKRISRYTCMSLSAFRRCHHSMTWRGLVLQQTWLIGIMNVPKHHWLSSVEATLPVLALSWLNQYCFSSRCLGNQFCWKWPRMKSLVSTRDLK